MKVFLLIFNYSIKIICFQPNDVQYAELALQMPKEEMKNQMNHNHIKKPPPPPAYTAYFDDPTIYAQIDHSSYNSKTSSTNLLGNSNTSLANGGILNQTAQYVQLISPLSHTSTTILNNQSLLLTSEHCLDQSLSPTTSIGNSYHTQTLQHPTKGKSTIENYIN